MLHRTSLGAGRELLWLTGWRAVEDGAEDVELTMAIEVGPVEACVTLCVETAWHVVPGDVALTTLTTHGSVTPSGVTCTTIRPAVVGRGHLRIGLLLSRWTLDSSVPSAELVLGTARWLGDVDTSPNAEQCPAASFAGRRSGSTFQGKPVNDTSAREHQTDEESSEQAEPQPPKPARD